VIRSALSSFAASRQKTFSDDRVHTVGASEVGQCLRKTWFSKNEIEADLGYEDRWGAKVRGTVYEDQWWAPALRATYGDRLLYAGSEQRTFFLDYLSATPDGLITGLERNALAHLGVSDIEADCIAVECKTADPRTRLDRPKPEHRFQVITQLGLIRERTNHRPVYGLLTYTDTSFWDEVFEFPIRFEPAVFAAAQQRAQHVMTSDDPFALPPEGAIAGGRECGYCPYAVRCGQVETRVVHDLRDEPVLDAALAQQIADKAWLAKHERGEAEQHIEVARRLEQEIKTDLGAAGTRKARHGGISVTWSSVKGRPATDWKAPREAAEKAGIDTARFATEGEPSDRLIITLEKETKT
jgi:hypothetical protein